MTVANTRDASFLPRPRHDGPGGHSPGTWSPRYHIKIDHEMKGGSWSACGKVFLLDYGDLPASEVPDYQRCKLNGCRQRWPQIKNGDTGG